MVVIFLLRIYQIEERKLGEKKLPMGIQNPIQEGDAVTKVMR